jgi:hypothetical protein
MCKKEIRPLNTGIRPLILEIRSLNTGIRSLNSENHSLKYIRINILQKSIKFGRNFYTSTRIHS